MYLCMCVCVCEQSEAFCGGHIQGTHTCVCGSGSSTTSHMDVDSTDASHSGQSVTQEPMTTGMTPARRAGEGAPMIDRAIHAWYEHTCHAPSVCICALGRTGMSVYTDTAKIFACMHCVFMYVCVYVCVSSLRLSAAGTFKALTCVFVAQAHQQHHIWM